MADKNSHFQHSDVSFWSVAAMLSGALAMISLTLAALLPPSFIGGLHASRLSGGSINQLMAQVQNLKERQTQMLAQTNQMRTRLSMAERGNGEVIRRVGALETTIPMLLEVVPPGAEIDPLSVTASVDDPNSTSFETDGGSVRVTMRPLFAPPDAQALPPPLAPAAPGDQAKLPTVAQPGQQTAIPTKQQSAPEAAQGADNVTMSTLPSGDLTVSAAPLANKQYGIAIGRVLNGQDAKTVWQNLSAKIGMLLIGLEPSVYDPQQNGKNRIVAGPIDDYAETEMLCSRIARVGIDCLPVQYRPDALLQL